MKKTFTTLFVVFTTTLFAVVPQKMSYQAVVRNSSNALVVNSNIGMQVSILQGSATGTSVYIERQFPTTNANGLVTIEIGSGTLVSGSFSTINWSTGTYFIKTEIDLNGGTNYTISGTSQMLSVPFALYALKAETASYTNLTNKPTTLSGYGITDAVNMNAAQTITGNKTFTGTTTVNSPVNSTDVATKAYVDATKNKIIAKGDNTSNTTFSIPDNTDIYSSDEGYWNANVVLPTPNTSNNSLYNRIGTFLLLKCNSSFSFNIKTDNTDLTQILNLTSGKSALFLFDGFKWKKVF